MKTSITITEIAALMCPAHYRQQLHTGRQSVVWWSARNIHVDELLVYSLRRQSKDEAAS